MTMRTIRKKLKETPLVGRVVNALVSDNPEENAPSIKAVLDNLRPKQLLINNDFQINQREQSEYTTKGYSLDMWLLAGDPFNGSLKINDNGTITITNKSTAYMYLSQKMNLQGKHIAVVKVVNKSGNCTQYFGGTNLSKELNVGVNSFGINQNFTEVGIRLGTNSSITVEYIDLFEGNIAYPHVKKRYSDDLLECRQYHKKQTISCVVAYKYTSGEYMYYGNIEPMFKTPTVKVLNAIVTDTSGNTNEFDHTKRAWVDENYYVNATIKFKREVHSTAFGCLLECEFSCEPL